MKSFQSYFVFFCLFFIVSCNGQGEFKEAKEQPIIEEATQIPANKKYLTSLAYPVDTIYTYVNIPNMVRPSYLVPITEANFGAELIRISGIEGFGVKDVRHHYSKDQAWNCDQSLILLNGGRIIDGNTYKFLKTIDIPDEGKWSYKDPQKIYGILGNKFVSLNVSTNVTTTLHTFSGYTRIYMGPWEGNISTDDSVVAFVTTDGPGGDIIIYDIVNDIIIATKSVNSLGYPNGIDWVSVSQSGKYVVIGTSSASKEPVKSYDRQLNYIATLFSVGEHSDIGYDAFGNEVLVSIGYPGQMARLDNGNKTTIFDVDDIFWGHISCRNYKRPGWAYVSIHEGDVMAIKLDGSKTIERFAMHRSSESSYEAEVQAIVNPNGTKVMFASDWGGTSEINSYVVSAKNNAPVIIIQPSSQTVSLGQSATFYVTASGSGTLSYQWKFNNMNIGNNSSALTVSNIQQGNIGNYTCTISNSFGSVTSSVAVLSITSLLPDLIITSLSYKDGVFTCLVKNQGTAISPSARIGIGYFVDGSQKTWGSIIATIGIGESKTFGTDGGAYVIPEGLHTIFAEVDDQNQVIESNETNNKYTASVNILKAPTITTQPINQTVYVGSNVTFSVTASGSFPMTFQWQKDGINIGSNSNTLTLSNVQLSQAGKYICIVSNATGTVTSNAATLLLKNNLPFQQSTATNNLVIIEAENFHSTISQGGKTWIKFNSISGYSGAGAIITSPFTGLSVDTGYLTGSPRCDYKVNFVKTGTHYIWVRGLWRDGNKDSVHIGLNGGIVTTADRIAPDSTSATNYTWARFTMDNNSRATVNISSTGVNTLNLYMREDGAIIDKILITSSSNFTPSGIGPGESARQ